MNYSVDDDLNFHHVAITSYGVDCWDDYHSAAKVIIDREIETKWYRESFADWATSPFDPDKLLNGAEILKTLSCFKTLELILGAIAKGEDRLIALEATFQKKYEKELKSVLASGFIYDADGDGEADTDEPLRSSHVMLLRG